MGIFAPDAFPEWIRVGLFWLGVALAVLGICLAGWHYRPKKFLQEHVFWRFALRSGDGRATKERPVAKRQSVPTPTYELNGDNDLPTSEFDYAYPKAVLKATIEKPTGTREARAGAEAHKMHLVMQLVNDHKRPLTPCAAVLHGMTINNEWVEVKEQMRASQATIPTGGRKHFPFLKRDLSDPVTPEPFLLLLHEREIALQENSDYTLLLELVCAYPIPTVVTVHLATGEGLNAQAEIVNMELGNVEPKE